MEETKSASRRGEHAKGILHASSTNISQKNQQLTKSTSFPRRSDTQYRVCTGETYQLAEIPVPFVKSFAKISEEAEELIDLDAADLFDSASSLQIDTPPSSNASTDSDSFDDLVSSSTNSEPQQFFKPVISRSQISLVPVHKGTTIRRGENIDKLLGIALLHRIMELANADPSGGAVLLEILGVHNGYGTGPDFDGADSQLHSVYQKKYLEIELNAKSKSGSSGVKTYSMGFNVNLFCRKVRAGNSSRSSVRSKGDIFKARFCPYEVVATREQFQYHISKMILIRKKAWNGICQQFDPPTITTGVDPDFEALAAAFFGGFEVPEKLSSMPMKGAKSYKITQNTGDRAKVLDADPIHDDELVVFLEDCIFSNEMEIAQRTGEKYWNLDVRKGPNHPGYRAIVTLEEEVKVLDQSTADDGTEAFNSRFARVDLLKKLLDEVPEAIVDISQPEMSVSQTDGDKVGGLDTTNPLGISDLEAIVADGKSKSGCTSTERVLQAQVDSEPTKIQDLTDPGVVAPGETAQSKLKKKKNKKKKKKPAGQQQSAVEEPAAEGLTFNNSYTQETFRNSTTGEQSYRDASRPKYEYSKTEASQFVDQDGSSAIIPTVIPQTSGKVAANADDEGQWETVGKGKQKRTRGDAPREIAHKSLQLGPSTQRNSPNNRSLSYKVAVPLFMKNSSARNTSQVKKLPESRISPNSSKFIDMTQQYVPVAEITNIHSLENLRFDMRDFDERDYPTMPSNASNTVIQPPKKGVEAPPHAQKAASLRVLYPTGDNEKASKQNRPAHVSTNSNAQSAKRRVINDDPKISFHGSVARSSPGIETSQQSPSEVPSTTKAPTTELGATRTLLETTSARPTRRRNRKKNTAALLTPGTPQGTSVTESAGREIETPQTLPSGPAATSPSVPLQLVIEADAPLMPSLIALQVEEHHVLNLIKSQPSAPVESLERIEFESQAEADASDEVQTPDIDSADLSESGVPASSIEVADQSTRGNQAGNASQILAVADLTRSTPVEEEKPETGARSHLADGNKAGRTSFHIPRSRSQETSSRNVQHRHQTSADEFWVPQPLENVDGAHNLETVVEHVASAMQVPSTDFEPQIQNFREFSQTTETSGKIMTTPYPHDNHAPVVYNGIPPHMVLDSQYGGFSLCNTQIPTQFIGTASYIFEGMVDTHAHPTANNFPFGNSSYLQPSERDPALEQVQWSSLKDRNCSFCQFAINAKPQYPASSCPFCVGDGGAIYCSTACQLADSYDHCMSCQHCPSYNNASVTPLVPNTLFRIENYPIRSSSYCPPSPECFRQKTFSMFCRTGEFPNLLGLWEQYKHFLPNNAPRTPEYKKHIGDYFVFRSAVTTGSPDHPPTDVICTISLDPRDAMKLCLRRLINACYVQPMEPFVGALFRTLRYLLADHTVFNTMTCHSAYAPQDDIIKEFMQQFSREFSFPANAQPPQQHFYFRREWDPIKSQMEEFERVHPILGYWKAKDIARQTFWTR